ncbi:hypothetical protein KGM_205064 [Danaus plexippus plexippus]|uniref:Uncharacterized protein n=1 Tax=Danaus plexippus plexippus TaxID=278856 RepID=A0A212EPT5_DANPL|nr:hypothetical protein KGM_205064 [Danaus plexippus plexippus]
MLCCASCEYSLCVCVQRRGEWVGAWHHRGCEGVRVSGRRGGGARGAAAEDGGAAQSRSYMQHTHGLLACGVMAAAPRSAKATLRRTPAALRTHRASNIDLYHLHPLH